MIIAEHEKLVEQYEKAVENSFENTTENSAARILSKMHLDEFEREYNEVLNQKPIFAEHKVKELIAERERLVEQYRFFFCEFLFSGLNSKISLCKRNYFFSTISVLCY